MNDTNLNQKKRMPPLIVLGLTGPFGSGCTAISHFFDNRDDPNRAKGNDLLIFLREKGWITRKVNGNFRCKWKVANEEVDRKYKELAAVGEAIKDYDECKRMGEGSNLPQHRKRLRKKLKKVFGMDLEDLLGKILGGDLAMVLEEIEEYLRRKLTKVLEQRETIKAFEKLEPYYDKDTHLFRTLSVSDLIVFHTLIPIEKENFNIDAIREKDKREWYKKFVVIAEKHMDGKNIKSVFRKVKVKGYRDYYKKCKIAKKKKMLELSKVFYVIHGIASTIKREFQENHPEIYVDVMQDFGDNIRRYGEPFGNGDERAADNCSKLAEDIEQMIYFLYETGQGAFVVVDCLRNPYEVIYLRRKFGNFFLLSVYADRKIRQKRICGEKTIDEFLKADDRDSGKKSKKAKQKLYMQDVTKCVQISDIAINNEKETEEDRNKMYEDIVRLVSLILSPGCTKTNADEMFMNLAYTMAVKSNCISRQVGAVIVGPKGYIVGAGWNDVGEGKISCGLREIRDLETDKEFEPLVKALLDKDVSTTKELVKQLCKLVESKNKNLPSREFCFCFKDEMAKKEVTPKLVEAWNNIFSEEIKPNFEEEIKRLAKVEEGKRGGKEKIEKAMKGWTNQFRVGIERLIKEVVARGDLHQLEYCLALHAEENAIIQSAKIGGMGLKGGTIYVTSQPCPLCAKKIQQIGLSKVVYTEAYPASLSDVYMKGVKLDQFEGVKPRAYIRLFMPHHDQKEWQELERKELVPWFA